MPKEEKEIILDLSKQLSFSHKISDDEIKDAITHTVQKSKKILENKKQCTINTLHDDFVKSKKNS